MRWLVPVMTPAGIGASAAAIALEIAGFRMPTVVQYMFAAIAGTLFVVCWLNSHTIRRLLEVNLVLDRALRDERALIPPPAPGPGRHRIDEHLN
jgi:hypothetical protein